MVDGSTYDDMFSIQAILLASSLLIVLGMVGSLMALAALRVRADTQAVAADRFDDQV